MILLVLLKFLSLSRFVAVFALSYTGQRILTWDAPDGATTRSNTQQAEQPPGNTLPGNFKIRAEISSIYAYV